MQAPWEMDQKITMITLMEDFQLGDEIQTGFASRGNPRHLFGRFEGGIEPFDLAVEDMIAN